MKPDLVLCGSLVAALARSFDAQGITWEIMELNCFLWELLGIQSHEAHSLARADLSEGQIATPYAH